MNCICLFSVGPLSMGRQEAFELFKRDYVHNKAIEENKLILKQLGTEAKQLGPTMGQLHDKLGRHAPSFRITYVL